MTHKGEHVRTRAPARPPDLHDVLDLVEMKAEPPGLSDEGKGRQNVRPVDPVPRGRPSRRRENPGPLVESKGLAAHPAAGGHFADQETVSSHAWSLNLAPGRKVKKKFSGRGGRARWEVDAQAEIKVATSRTP